MMERDNVQQDLSASKITGPFSGKLDSLNEYVNFPLELRGLVLRGIMVARRNAPTDKESIIKELETSDLTLTHGGKEFDEFYGVLADLFVKSIDNSYKGNPAILNPTLKEYRDKFYRMIRPLSAEDLDHAVEAILEYNHTETT